MYAGVNKLNNLCVILDNNKMQNETYKTNFRCNAN